MTAISDETLRKKCDLEPWVKQKSGHIKFGTVPEQFEAMAKLMPENSPEQQNFIDAATRARDIYREQIIAQFNPDQITEAGVKQMCKDEPWTTAHRVEDVATGKFGYVIEKFKNARNMFAEGSHEHAMYDNALTTARGEYFAQMHDMSRRFATGKKRAAVEEMNGTLFAMSHRLEDNGTYVGNRLYTLCELKGEYFRMTGEVIKRSAVTEQFSALGAKITKLAP